MRSDHEGCTLEKEVRLRIEVALGNESFRRLGAEFHVHSETIRRQLRGNVCVSLRVLAAVCSKTGVSADWLLFGTEPRLNSDKVAHALQTAPLMALVDALGQRVRSPASQAEPSVLPADQRACADAAETLARIASQGPDPGRNGSNGVNRSIP